MAIESISQATGATRLTFVSRPPETIADARESAAQRNDSRRLAESLSGASPAYLSGPLNTTVPVSTGTYQPPVPAPSTVEISRPGALTQAAEQAPASTTGQAQQVGQTAQPAPGGAGETASSALRSATEAYRAESLSRAEETRRQQQQASGAQSLNIMA